MASIVECTDEISHLIQSPVLSTPPDQTMTVGVDSKVPREFGTQSTNFTFSQLDSTAKRGLPAVVHRVGYTTNVGIQSTFMTGAPRAYLQHDKAISPIPFQRDTVNPSQPILSQPQGHSMVMLNPSPIAELAGSQGLNCSRQPVDDDSDEDDSLPTIEGCPCGAADREGMRVEPPSVPPPSGNADDLWSIVTSVGPPPEECFYVGSVDPDQLV
jgi:hypothetical protein